MSEDCDCQVVLEGKSASKGVGIGKAKVVAQDDVRISEHAIDDDQKLWHVQRIDEAKRALDRHLKELKYFAEQNNQDEAAEILETQIQILFDPELEEQSLLAIHTYNRPADRAIWDSFQYFIELLEQSRNEYMMQRIPDINDVRNRLIRLIHSLETESTVTSDRILVTDEISPAEVLEAWRANVQAIIVNKGGLTSHAAIIAHALEIPFIFGISNATRCIHNDDHLIVDGNLGNVYVNAAGEIKETYTQKRQLQEQQRIEALQTVQRPSVMRCGTPFTLRANVEFEEELVMLLQFHAEGIGLVRTESMLLESGNTGIDDQVRFYSRMLEQTAPHPVTIRLLDIGGDKGAQFLPTEPNPFLGWRGIRFLLDQKKLLVSQLTALGKVAELFPGRVRILIPMLAILNELHQFFEVLNELPTPFPREKLQIGAMIEVPSLIFQLDSFCEHLDFFSVGTNDLTQYLLAADRGNSKVAQLYNPFHPSVFQAIRNGLEVTLRHSKTVGVCGEAASNPYAAMVFFGMGISELSMTAVELPSVKKVLTSVTLDDCKRLAQNVLASSCGNRVQELFQEEAIRISTQ